MKHAPRTLISIFSDTDNVCYGPFAIVKDAGESFEDAIFMVDGTEVPMDADQKKVMALLISQQGQTVNVLMLFEGLGAESFNGAASGINRPQQIRQWKAAYGAQITRIQDAIAETFGAENPETDRYLESFVTVRRHALRTTQTDLKSGYRLNVPTHDLEVE